MSGHRREIVDYCEYQVTIKKLDSGAIVETRGFDRRADADAWAHEMVTASQYAIVNYDRRIAFTGGMTYRKYAAVYANE